MQLNLNQLEMIGRIEVARRQLSEATSLILNGANPLFVQSQLGIVINEIAEARNELPKENWNA